MRTMPQWHVPVSMIQANLFASIAMTREKNPSCSQSAAAELGFASRQWAEGTLDQLYLALRLAALDVRRAAGVDVPVILEDALMTSDDDRSGVMLEALADFARGNQVLVFTHHRHIADIAVKHVPHDVLAPLDL
jgi:uncharacterized protein YhaN